MVTVADVRPSPIAGLWYPGDPETLRQQVDGFLDAAEIDELDGEAVAVIAPHAGYRYSGATAGYAFRSVRGASPELVVVVSPLHAYHPALLLTSAHRCYQTPLGTVIIDRQAVQRLGQRLGAESDLELAEIAYDGEHSLEIELPFLQQALAGSFQLLPVMVRSQSPELALTLGRALAEVCRGRSALLVASTDLSHFYPEATANVLDGAMLKQIAAFSPEGVLTAEHSGTGFACGAGAVAAVLWAAKQLGGDTVQLLHHSTSADETGDVTSVVGYGAAVVLKHG